MIEERDEESVKNGGVMVHKSLCKLLRFLCRISYRRLLDKSEVRQISYSNEVKAFGC